ncbi:hypothetical protein [Psychromonas sp. KJ10-2]|uniref:hypothetical protein n=1 Tax=Psychromonas sp. KJ10-2 TaxID=3391822 RepID=UPI0039B44D33
MSNIIEEIQAPSRLQRFKDSDFIYHFKRDKVAMFSFAVFLAFLLPRYLRQLFLPLTLMI